MFKRILILFLLSSLLSSAFASSRTDALLSQDASVALDNYLDARNELDKSREELNVIDGRIKKSKKGQTVYLEFKKIAGSLLIVGIVIASYKAYFPPGFRVMLGSYVTLNGLSHGMIKLSNADINKLINGINRVQLAISNYEQQLIIKKNYYCKQEPRHLACY